MKILVINAGSSSLKYQLFDMDNESIIAKGACERIGIEGSQLKHTPAGKESVIYHEPMPDHVAAIKLVFDALMDPNTGVIKSMDEINAVGHRILHGGDKFTESALVTEPVKDAIREAIPLGPLHNPANLMGIEACEKVMPGTPQVAVFDTAFHQSMPMKSFLYALPYEYYEKYKVRRYGFHGTSHRYISARAAAFLGKKPEELKIVTCHLGNGSSLAAVKYGKCFDTSMGLTPLEGLPMGTRSGSLDPAVLGFIMPRENLTIEEMTTILNKKSGVLGVSGLSSDFRDLGEAAANGNERAALALEMFRYNVVKLIGAYTAGMGGTDVIVFTAGVGENDGALRANVCADLEFMGVEIDPEKNAIRGEEVEISTPDSKVRVLVIPTNEELVIARDTKDIVTAAK